jgi:hypothetical protein
MSRGWRGTLARFYRLNFSAAEYVHRDLNQHDRNKQQEGVGAL